MPARFELTFDITQAELAAANEAAMRVQPEWERARKLARRSIRNFAIFGVADRRGDCLWSKPP